MHLLLGISCLALMALGVRAQTVTNLQAVAANGQVYLTWTNVADDKKNYRVYRSTNPIVQGTDLLNCEYLGWTDASSAINFHLTYHDGIDRYWKFLANGDTLIPGMGFFVAPTFSDGSYYYAVTTFKNTIEDKTIVVGANALAAPVLETVMTPEPILLEVRMMDGYPIEVYGHFLTSKISANGPFQFNCGWLGYCFAVNANGATGNQPLYMKLHAGGTDFFKAITDIDTNEVRLGLEDYFPSFESSGWIGTHQNYNPLKKGDNKVPPDTGTNFFHAQRRIIQTIDWVCKKYNIDTNRIILEGTSFGASGAFFLAVAYPYKFSAINLSGGIFNFAFSNDYNPNCTMNEGKKNREDGDKKFGKVSTNLPEASGFPTYFLLNGGAMAHYKKMQGLPFIRSINGKHDNVMGWTEKTIWYDSVNRNHVGGAYFFDMREHDGSNRTWDKLKYDLYRYGKNISFPAFSWCTANHDPGDGTDTSGASYGTINGFLDWSDDIVDEADRWQIKIFMKSLTKVFGEIELPPDSCRTYITPRRLQKFHPPLGTIIHYATIYKGDTIYKGTFVYDGGLMTVADVPIFADTVLFTLYTLPPDTNDGNLTKANIASAHSFLVKNRKNQFDHVLREAESEGDGVNEWNILNGTNRSQPLVYPVPASHILYLSLPDEEISFVDVQLRNAMGMVVGSERLWNKDHVFPWHLPSLPAGYYSIQWQTKEKRWNVPVLIAPTF